MLTVVGAVPHKLHSVVEGVGAGGAAELGLLNVHTSPSAFEAHIACITAKNGRISLERR